jgi:hypothetical protein
MFGVFPQQSIREMERSNRTPQNVIDDATWGVFQMDYQVGYGSDADHLKNMGAIDDCIAVGFVGFTLDPNEHVDNAAHTDDVATLQSKFDSLPWDELETTAADLKKLYIGSTPGGEIDEEALLRATGKYSRAIAHVKKLARHIASSFDGQPYDLEVSVDETDTPTSPAEHYFIAAELNRLGVKCEGLAPRFIGSFE